MRNYKKHNFQTMQISYEKSKDEKLRKMKSLEYDDFEILKFT